MATNLGLDDKLIEKAVKIGKHKSKNEAVTAALTEYIKTRKQKEIIDIFGTIEYDNDYDYKKQRALK